MMYLMITQATAAWLLRQANHREAIARQLGELSAFESLKRTILTIGALRAAASPDGRVLALWNVDYISNTGEELWGGIKLEGRFGLLAHGDVVKEVFERELYIVNQRLQRLLLDERLIHRARDGGLHTCIAGRGAEAREHRLVYFEGDVLLGSTESKTVICFGPAWEDDSFLAAVRKETADLGAIVRTANSLLNDAGGRPVAETGLFGDLTERFPSNSTQVVTAETPVEDLPELSEAQASSLGAYQTADWTYEQWLATSSPLTAAQRRIVESSAIDVQPIRIVGAAGSGKTLLMMLLAIRRLYLAREQKAPLRVLYVAHNAAMQNAAYLRFIALGASEFMDDGMQKLEVKSLIELSREMLGSEDAPVIHSDAHETKTFQLQQVRESLAELLAGLRSPPESAVFARAKNDENFALLLSSFIADEIAIAIKGHGLTADRKRYVESERRLSRFHGLLDQEERGLVFECFVRYHKAIFEVLEVFDADDLALSLLARLHTPIWEMRRKKLGFDHVFVDETQLFNENERKLFPLLTKGKGDHVSVVLALDEAQQTRGAVSAGLGLLGFQGIADEKLGTVHRCTGSILKLAFFVIQRTTDLFGPDFPDFTGQTVTVIPSEHPLAAHPRLVMSSEDSRNIGKFALKQVRLLRKQNVRQIGIVCHSEVYWAVLRQELSQAELPFVLLTQRGERVYAERPLVVLARPDSVGGQEFDAVVAVGLEQGVVPPRVDFNQGLYSALEQQAFREMYVSFTRARYRLVVVNSFGSAPTAVLQQAIRAGLMLPSSE
ncbi:UvrD-helicase domain-containing protein [Myxococcus fulvus]|uniref:UvrD-helicase domain-containing protein n=1 Tax=Myxococcus fulvus TaxID=33 RepID=UPI0020C00282|nr:UvrD-helicase domain-containing protein [Myxococcus fulvus]MCK8504223.1 hypothetical protein [Myxococcus fulvus]